MGSIGARGRRWSACSILFAIAANASRGRSISNVVGGRDAVRCVGVGWRGGAAG